MNDRPLAPALIAECLGTALLVLIGDGVAANLILIHPPRDGALSLALGWGFALALGMFVGGRAGGGHLNPALTLALAYRGEFPAGRVVAYWAAQLVGAIAGAGLVLVNYAGAFRQFEADRGIIRGALAYGRLEGTAAGGAGVFCTFPALDNLAGSLLNEILASAVFLIGVRAVGDRKARSLPPVLVGGVMVAIGLAFGGLTGPAINPARDLGPRLVAAVGGWGWASFASHDYYFWVPIVGPFLGGLVGITVYDRLIAQGLPSEPDPSGGVSRSS